MKQLMIPAILSLLTACGGYESQKEEEDSTSEQTSTDTDFDVNEDVDIDENDRFADFIYLTEPAIGEMSCFDAGYDELGSWNDQAQVLAEADGLDDGGESYKANLAARQEAGVMQSLTLNVVDFETEDPVAEATADVFFANQVFGAEDVSVVSDSAGQASAEMQVCKPYSYQTYTDPALNNTKVTIESNQIDALNATTTELNSVSRATYQVIPALLGVSPDENKGIVSGAFYGCDGEPIEGGQVVVFDAEGNIPDDLVVKYFIDRFPNRNQEWTSADGLWVAINIPPGDWFINAFVADGAGGHKLMGSTSVKVFADSINISSVYLSYGNGISYPDDCFSALEE